MPPFNYQGPCSINQTFIGASPLDKQQAELACGVCWPCQDDIGCERDWSRPCPYAYTAEGIPFIAFADAGGSVCAADLDYHGDCETFARFVSEKDKHEFAQRCSVTWPCKTSCETEIEAICPLDWVHIGEFVCAAPSYYKEDGCNVLQSFHGWPPTMKSAYASRCRTMWPCQGDMQVGLDEFDNGPVNMMPKCASLNLESCPISWSLSADGACHPPHNSIGPCADIVNVNAMTTEEKLQWSGKCLLSWPCQEVADNESEARATWKAFPTGKMLKKA